MFFRAGMAFEQFGKAEVWNGADRRKKAVLGIMDRACTNYDNIRARSIEESLAEFEISCFTSYGRLDMNYNVSLAASIWILDGLRRNGKLHEACKYLPSSIMEIGDVDMPVDFYHPCYERELIQSVAHAVCFRNSKATDSFKGLMSCLNQDRIQAAVEEFKRQQWDVIGRFLKTEEYFDQQMIRIASKLRLCPQGCILSLRSGSK